ncbi:MAG: aquaporin family protein [Gammaproteobacteria bacterium]|jgi:glycerol uptake facilitator-like aquaporin|nr:aquaporin family protein [Gammaproteobacteria bacterium]|tara:strand:+ start:3609 stop:4250 length:642 start_codon:yes stop_codon:yes gene_type:complete
MKPKLISEFIGTMFLLMIIVGSGIMAANLTEIEAIILLANSFATIFGLIVLILMFRQISGAHFNPAVSLIFFLTGNIKFYEFILYSLVQIIGGILGVILVHYIFELDIIQLSSKNRGGMNLFISEIVASFGLIMTILLIGKSNKSSIPYAVGLYIGAGYWFTSSTSFANPAVTISRSLTDTFTGISPDFVLNFIVGQILGALLGYLVFKYIYD